MSMPSPRVPYRGEEYMHVLPDRRRQVAGQDMLEMPARQRVLPLEEESPGQFEAHAHEFRTADQKGVENRNRPIQQHPPLAFLQAARPGPLQQRQAGKEGVAGVQFLPGGRRFDPLLRKTPRG